MCLDRVGCFRNSSLLLLGFALILLSSLLKVVLALRGQLLGLLDDFLLVAAATELRDDFPATRRSWRELRDSLRQQCNVFLRPVVVLNDNLFLLLLLGGLASSSLFPLGLCLSDHFELTLEQLHLGRDIQISSGFDGLDDCNDHLNFFSFIQRVSLFAFNPESIEIGSRKCLLDECDQGLDASLVGEVGCFLGRGGCYSFILLCLFRCLFLLLDFPYGLCLGQLGGDLALADLFLLSLLLGLDLGKFRLNTRVIVVSSLDEPDYSASFSLLVLGADASVFILHVAPLVPVLSLVGVVLVVLGELTPRLEFVPEAVELLHVGQRHVLIAEVGRIFVDRPPRV